MTREEWTRVKEIAAAALDRPAATRAAYLTAECSSDQRLRHEVDALVDAVERAASCYETPTVLVDGRPIPPSTLDTLIPGGLDAIAADRSRSFVGHRFGAYRVVSEIGRGGMGAVYLAERADDEYRQRVAIKVAHRAVSPATLRWFRAERQILATLDHPNIARLLDGGTTAEGLPFLVMEYVEGKPIDEYCEDAKLSIDDRLMLFGQVCAALAYAHRSLVVHRDLKPRNILVAGGRAKLLDFGIAKLLGDVESVEADEEPGVHTAGIMTPEYASPEQIRGGPMTTATDVYALGVLLYKLLTGLSPYRVPAGDARALAAAVCDQPAAPPSTSTSDPSRRRRLAGDLDAILLKALHKEPSARYATVDDLAADIDRHANSRPVAARERDRVYRAGRFIARHRTSVAAAVLLVVTLLGGLGATLWQARVAEQERARGERHFSDVRRMASSLIFELHDGIENLPGAIATRQLLVERSLAYFDGLAAEERNDPALQRELAAAYDKLANVLGRPYASNLGNTGAALVTYRKALTIRERLARDFTDRDTQLALWSSYYNVGALLRERSDTAGALQMHAKASALVTSLLRDAPTDAAITKAAARTAVTRAHTFEQAGQIEASLASARDGLRIDEGLLARDPSNNALRADIATGHGRVGTALLRLGDAEQALRHMRQRVALAVQLTAADPGNVSYRRGLSTSHLQLGQALSRGGDLAAAVREQRMALDLRRQLAAQDPADRQAQVDLMFAQLELGQTLAQTVDTKAAETELRAAIDSSQRLVDADPDYVFYRLSHASALNRLAVLLSASSRAADAAPLARRAIALMESSARADPTDVRLQVELALAWDAMGSALAGRAGGLPQAASDDSPLVWYRRSLDALERLRDSGLLSGGTLLGGETAKISDLESKVRRLSSAG